MNSKAAVLEAHPIIVLETIVDRYGGELDLTFSRYKVGPPGDQERRSRATFEIKARRATRAWLKNELRDLGQDDELALHSCLSLGGLRFHFFMIDYQLDCSLPVVRNLGVGILAETRFAPPVSAQRPPQLYTFETGRCYHQYADLLMPEPAWHRYLGSLLLLTPACQTPVVDVRWIGHALRRGYAALRWSHNTKRYLSMPKLVDRSATVTYQTALGSAQDDSE